MIDSKKVTFDGVITGIFATIMFAILCVFFYALVYEIAKGACR